ncbi:MAG: DUF2232 domain-containing protein [Gammaproteobacteria bacterium]|nr:MAG: DUF2232 domain-containing protein [Gammaproteobacteria bacterium]
MLRSIADISMRGRWQSAAVIAVLSLAALILPPFSYLASGVIALTTLRMGPKEGIKTVAATTLVFTLLVGLMLKQIGIAGLFLVSSWLPILGISLILGYTRSFAVSLLAASGLGIVLVLGMNVMLDDPALWWQEAMTPFMTLLSEQPGWTLSQTETQSMLIRLSSMMTGFFAAGFSLNVMLGLIIGRAWQAKLYNPGGFATEFQQFSLGKKPALLLLFCMLAALSPLGDAVSILKDCLPVMLVVFALQGLSIVHSIVKRQQKHDFWLIAVYILLIAALLQMVVLLAIIGVLEQWFNFRRLSNESDE